MDLPINRTLATEVVLLGFSKNFKLNLVLSFFFSAVYFITVFGNGFMVCAIIISVHLHTPMYFFISNLAVIDLLYSSLTVPKLLVVLLFSSGKTSLTACAIQVFVGLFLGNTESLLLVLMAYDRYVAICKPLYYPVHMRWSICYRLIALVWVSSFMTTVVPSLLMPIMVCNPNQINHFACEVLAVVKLSCSSSHKSEIMIFFLSFFSLLIPFVFILLSYIFIISSVLSTRSAGRKAFSTCSSHLTVVVMLYGTAMVMYFGPPSNYASNQAKYISVFYYIMIPMLNPLIYSLKNKEVTKIFLVKKEVSNSRTGIGQNN